MDGVLLEQEHALEAYAQRHDAAVHPAAEWPELLLWVLFKLH